MTCACPVGTVSVGPGCIASDGGASDGATPADAGPAVPAGRWEGCDNTLSFAPDGTLVYENLREGCTAAGTWRVVGSRITLSYPATVGCPDLAGQELTGDLLVSSEGLAIVDTGSGNSLRYAVPGTAVQTWRADLIEQPAATTGVTIFRVVGTVGLGFGVGCYWASDGECGGGISCGGPINSWMQTADTFAAGLACDGECPCTATVEGTPTSAAAIDGTFDVSTCVRRFGGTISLRLLP